MNTGESNGEILRHIKTKYYPNFVKEPFLALNKDDKPFDDTLEPCVWQMRLRNYYSSYIPESGQTCKYRRQKNLKYH